MSGNYTKHEKGQMHYIGPTTRLCPECPDGCNVHALEDFKSTRNADGEYFAPVCRKCQMAIKKFHRENEEDTAITLLSNSIAKATRLRQATGTSYAEALDSVCSKMGGAERTFQTVGRACSRAMRRGLKRDAHWKDLDRAVKVGEILLNTVASVEKAKGPPIDLSELTEDEIHQILMEPARKLILTSQEFRNQLLNDLEVRRALLLEADVELVEATGGAL